MSDNSDDEMLVGSITQSHLNTEHLKVFCDARG